MIALRKDAEQALGNKFVPLHFQDFILLQGLLPPALINKAVIEEFVTEEKKRFARFNLLCSLQMSDAEE